MQTLDDDGESIETFDLLEIAGASSDFSMVRLHATLGEAIERMRDADTSIVLVTRVEAATSGSIYGVLTRDQIEASVRYRGLSRPG